MLNNLGDKMKNKIITIAIIFISITLSIAIFSVKSKNIHSIPTPNEDHPRLFLSSKDIKDLKSKATSQKLKPAWNIILKNSETKPDTVDKLEVRKIYESDAFVYLVTNNREYAKKAIDLALKNLNQLNVNKTKASDYNNSQIYGRIMLSGAMVYDWCYKFLTKEQKMKFISQFEKIAKSLEEGYPPKIQSTITGHSSEEVIMRDLLGTGIAIYDEKKEMYNICSSYIFNEYIPVRKFIYKSGMYYQGNDYGPTRFSSDMFVTWIYDRMGYGNIFGVNQGKLLYRTIYSRRPDGRLLKDGDMFMDDNSAYPSYPMETMLASNYYKDPYLINEFNKEYDGPGTIDPIFEMLFIDPNLKEKSFKTLPLTRYFGAPMGSMIARTGWNFGSKSNDVVAEMKGGAYQFNNHQHLDFGSFQIYYKGALAIDSGIYEGTSGGYGSSHDINYNKRTIAHNSMLVYDPKEVFRFDGKRVSNDGGQNWPNNGYEAFDLSQLNSKGYERGKDLHWYFGPDNISPDFSYIKCDLTHAYSSKVKNYKRSMVFINFKDKHIPAAMIVFDKIDSSNPGYKKSWLLHSIEEPQVNNNISTIKVKGGGKLVDTAILPSIDNLQIEKVGGSGKEFYYDGTNYENSPQKSNTTNEAGGWRIEISPQAKANTDLFLNVLQVMGTKYNALPVKKINGSDNIGVVISNYAVMFNKSGEDFKKNVTFDLTCLQANKKYKLLFCDLQEGKWTVYKDGKKIMEQKTVNRNAGSIFCVGTSGKYTFEYKK